jgi:hypothetical protein
VTASPIGDAISPPYQPPNPVPAPAASIVTRSCDEPCYCGVKNRRLGVSRAGDLPSYPATDHEAKEFCADDNDDIDHRNRVPG